MEAGHELMLVTSLLISNGDVHDREPRTHQLQLGADPVEPSQGTQLSKIRRYRDVGDPWLPWQGIFKR